MNLYRCYHADCEYKDQVLFIYGNNADSVWHKIAEIHSVKDYYKGFLEDEEYEEERECFIGIAFLSAVEAFKMTERHLWTIEEYLPLLPPSCDYYIAYPQDINSHEDVICIPVYDDIQDIEDYVYTRLGEINAEKGYFRETITDLSPDGLDYRFFKFNGKNMWIENIRQGVSKLDTDTIREWFAGDKDKADKFISLSYEANVRDFFKGYKEWADEFLEYTRNPRIEPDFSDEMYCYCAKQLLLNGEWDKYEIVKVSYVAN